MQSYSYAGPSWERPFQFIVAHHDDLPGIVNVAIHTGDIGVTAAMKAETVHDLLHTDWSRTLRRQVAHGSEGAECGVDVTMSTDAQTATVRVFSGDDSLSVAVPADHLVLARSIFVADESAEAEADAIAAQAAMALTDTMGGPGQDPQDGGQGAPQGGSGGDDTGQGGASPQAAGNPANPPAPSEPAQPAPKAKKRKAA